MRKIMEQVVFTTNKLLFWLHTSHMTLPASNTNLLDFFWSNQGGKE